MRKYRLWQKRFREERTSKVEFDYFMKQFDALMAKKDEVMKLTDSTTALGDRVKETIEIMDEDHGKAIRVFTIVTVFFLPMYAAPPLALSMAEDIRWLNS
jgi:2-hydroxy-3-keto-5-methylthiopentenyl-1-phosphate phosphatase